MSWRRRVLLALAAAVVLGDAWVRLAPLDPARWHQAAAPQPPGDYAGDNRFHAVRALTRPGPEVLADLDRLIRATPRTRVLAGSVQAGMVTYVTRSAVWGFPDLTTVTLEAGTLSIRGRARFGRGDLGVNRARIEGWLDAMSF